MIVLPGGRAFILAVTTFANDSVSAAEGVVPAWSMHVPYRRLNCGSRVAAMSPTRRIGAPRGVVVDEFMGTVTGRPSL